MLPRRASNTWRTAAACYKLLADRRIGSATLVADAPHSWPERCLRGRSTLKWLHYSPRFQVTVGAVER